MGEERRLIEAELPQEFDPDWTELDAATNEHPFMHAGVELLKEAGTVCLLASGIVPTAPPYQRDEAIRCGLLVRIGKLCRLMLADTCEVGGGQQLALSRQIFDTTATLMYLSADDDGSRHQAFVEDPLVAEREIVRDIDRRQSGDGGGPWAIEDRMRRSIDRSARAAGIEDVSALPSRAKIGWPSARALSALLGPTAYPAYRVGSGEIHGSWHDLYRNHLREVSGGFEPTFETGSPRPQPLLAVAVLAVQAVRAYLRDRNTVEAAFFDARLTSLDERLQRVDAAHEGYLQQ